MSYLYQPVCGYSEFRDLFRNFDRLDDFTYDRLHQIYEYLTECAESTGRPLEVDVIAICCEDWDEILGVMIDSIADVRELVQDYGTRLMQHFTDAEVNQLYRWMSDNAGVEVGETFTIDLDEFRDIDLDDVFSIEETA